MPIKKMLGINKAIINKYFKIHQLLHKLTQIIILKIPKIKKFSLIRRTLKKMILIWMMKVFQMIQAIDLNLFVNNKSFIIK
jgi:hypothetical protein